MKRLWTVLELVEQWSVSLSDRELLHRKESTGRLGLVAQLAFYRRFARFPEHRGEFTPMVIDHLAEQIGASPSTLDGYEWTDRTGRRHRETILEHLGVVPFDLVAEMKFRSWLLKEALPLEPNDDTLEEWITTWLLRSQVERPGDYNGNRILRGAKADHDEAVFRAVLGRLDPAMCGRLKALVVDGEGGPPLARVRADPGRVGLDSLLEEIEKLRLLRALGLPPDILKAFHPGLVKRFRRRSAAESTWDLDRHPDEVGLPLLVFYCVPREAQIVDGLVELLMQITHRMSAKAERRVEREVVAEFRRVRGKEGLLYRIAEAASEQPDGIVREVIFPVVGEETLANLVREARASGGPFRRKVHTVMRASYGSHYRRMLPKLLDVLDFRSNNASHRPLLDAIDTIKSRIDEQRQHYKVSEIVVEGVIRPMWRELVIEQGPDGEERVNRINYELCVLESLRERVRCKEVWVAGAHRFRNPDDDLPNDFAARRPACYERLGIPLAADVFIETLRDEMTKALERLDQRMPKNPCRWQPGSASP